MADTRSEQIFIRVSRAERGVFNAAAARTGQQLATWARGVLAQAAGTGPAHVPPQGATIQGWHVDAIGPDGLRSIGPGMVR